jgi:hypothetical protein
MFWFKIIINMSSTSIFCCVSNCNHMCYQLRLNQGLWRTLLILNLSNIPTPDTPSYGSRTLPSSIVRHKKKAAAAAMASSAATTDVAGSFATRVNLDRRLLPMPPPPPPPPLTSTEWKHVKQSSIDSGIINSSTSASSSVSSQQSDSASEANSDMTM